MSLRLVQIHKTFPKTNLDTFKAHSDCQDFIKLIQLLIITIMKMGDGDVSLPRWTLRLKSPASLVTG